MLHTTVVVNLFNTIYSFFLLFGFRLKLDMVDGGNNVQCDGGTMQTRQEAIFAEILADMMRAKAIG